MVGEYPVESHMRAVNPRTQQIDTVRLSDAVMAEHPQLMPYVVVEMVQDATPNNAERGQEEFPEMQGPKNDVIDLDSAGDSAFENPPN